MESVVYVAYVANCTVERVPARNPGTAAPVKYRDPKNGEAGAAMPLGPDPETGARSSQNKKIPLRVYWSHGVQRVMKTGDNKTLSVPIYVSLCLITGKLFFHGLF